MKITRFNLHYLFGEEWAIYLTFLIKAIKETGAEKLNLVPLIALLEANATQAALAMEVIRKSEYTRRCNDADEKRDRLISSVNNYVRSFLYDEVPAVRDAAENLMIVIDHYAGMANENRDQESGRIIQFVSELTENHTARIKLLEGLERRLNQLSEANAEYIRLQDERTFANAEKGTVRMAAVRREGDRLMRSVWDLTDIMLLSAPTPDIELFAARLDTENRNVRSKLTARKGRRETAEETE